MKKVLGVILLVIGAFLLFGCGTMMNDHNPNEAVETLFEKYRNKDENVLSQLKQTIESEILDEDNKVKYEKLMEKQYDSFSYVIKDTNINDDEATVSVDITVLDYKTALEKAEKELKANPEKFNDDEGKLSDDKYMTYKIELMDKVESTKTYTLDLYLTKTAGMWKVNELSSEDIKKLHGIY